jgi:hypothetical protein
MRLSISAGKIEAQEQDTPVGQRSLNFWSRNGIEKKFEVFGVEVSYHWPN